MEKREKKAGRPALLKEINMGLLKKALAQKGEATRVELAEITKISQPTVNQLIRELLENGTVVSRGILESTGGRKAESYALNPKQSNLAVITVTAQGFRVRMMDLSLESGKQKEYIRQADCTYLEQLTDILQEMKKKNPQLEAVSIGVPGAVSQQGEVFAIPQIPEWERFALKEKLQEKVAMPVLVTNDINATAVGVKQLWEPVRNLIYLHMDGCSIGAGFIVDGRLYSGCGSFAGEIGYMRSGTKSVEEALQDGGGEEVLLEQILINLICVLNPERIVLGGSDHTKQLPGLIKACQKRLPEHVIPQIETIKDSEKYYELGLGKLGLKLLNHDVYVMGGGYEDH